MQFKKRWQYFEGGPVGYAMTGQARITYWLLFKGQVVRVSPATPSAYSAMVLAHAHKQRARAYEVYAFGSKAIGWP